MSEEKKTEAKPCECSFGDAMFGFIFLLLLAGAALFGCHKLYNLGYDRGYAARSAYAHESAADDKRRELESEVRKLRWAIDDLKKAKTPNAED